MAATPGLGNYSEHRIGDSLEVLYELIPYGRYIRVAAIDAITNTEITFIGESSKTAAELRHYALKKLIYVMNKKGLLDKKKGRSPHRGSHRSEQYLRKKGVIV